MKALITFKTADTDPASKFESGRYPHAVAIAAIALGIYFLAAVAPKFPLASLVRAKKTSALNTAFSLQDAINSFITEYGSLPAEGNQVATDSPEGVKLLVALHGDGADPAVSSGARSIRFLNAPEGKNMRGGMICDSSGKLPVGLYDTWGNPYIVVLDTDFDERLQFKWGTQSVDLKGRRAAVFSAGPDQTLGTADDVRTW